MAVTPKQAAKLTDVESSVVHNLEAQIDSFLNKNYVEGVAIVVPQKSIGAEEISTRVFEAIRSLYAVAGWAVSRHSDSINGSWLEFDPK